MHGSHHCIKPASADAAPLGGQRPIDRSVSTKRDELAGFCFGFGETVAFGYGFETGVMKACAAAGFLGSSGPTSP